MSEGAHVDSIDALRHFRVALIKFMESCDAAMNDSEGEVMGVLHWLEHEQTTRWQSEIRRQEEAVGRAREAVRMKKVFKDSLGRTPAAIEEEKALRKAEQLLAMAQQKFAATKKYVRVLQREIQVYKGGVQRFVTTLHSDLPSAAARLDQLSISLENYVRLAAADGQTSSPAQSSSVPSSPAPSPDAGTDPAKPSQ